MPQSNIHSTHPMVQILVQQLRYASDPHRAEKMQLYMKTMQPFYGVHAPVRKGLLAGVKKQFKLASFEEYQRIIRELWARYTP